MVRYILYYVRNFKMVACVIEIVRKCRIINYNNKKYNIKLSHFKIINKIKANENQCGNRCRQNKILKWNIVINKI